MKPPTLTPRLECGWVSNDQHDANLLWYHIEEKILSTLHSGAAPTSKRKKNGSPSPIPSHLFILEIETDAEEKEEIVGQKMAPSLSTLTSTRYALVVDAGSSGSRLQIYSWLDPEAERQQIVTNVKEQWKDRKGKGRATPAQLDELEWMTERSLRRLVKVEKGVKGDDWVKRQEPGISAQTPSSLREYLTPLLDHALQHIPPSQHAETPIYILATAGMRLIPDKQRSDILETTCKILRKDYPFRLDGANELGPCGESVRVISGEEEGMWGWVAVNYLMDGFGHAPEEEESMAGDSLLLPLPPLQTETVGIEGDIPPTFVDPRHRSPTFGFLDMGGASTQIAFSPTINELEHSNYPTDDLRSVSLRLLSGQTVDWPVFVASWLGFGTNRAREKYEEVKILEWQKARQDEDGSLDLAVPSPVVPGDRAHAIHDPCLPSNLYIESKAPDRPPFLGTGSFPECLAVLSPLLESETPCPPPSTHCLFAGLPTPHIDFQREDQRGFIGISEYWYTAQQVLGLGGVWDYAEWEKGMRDFCARDWEDVEQVFEESGHWQGSAIERSRLELQCFKGAWISNVLHEGIGIPRLVDDGGNQTLTGGEIGDTNEEAERRAVEKGLRSHFQSLDTIGETAISWTLGKMVIEASKAVQPHGYQRRPVGIVGKWSAALSDGKDRVSNAMGLPSLESKMAAHGVDAAWAYFGLFFTLFAFFYLFLRKRRWFNRGGAAVATVNGRRRKPSDVGWARTAEDYVKLEEQTMDNNGGGGGGRNGKTFGKSSGRLKFFGVRLSSITRKFLKPWSTTTHDSRLPRGRKFSTEPSGTGGTGFPLNELPPAPGGGNGGGRHEPLSLSASYATSSSLSLPPSPRGDQSTFFTPGYDTSDDQSLLSDGTSAAQSLYGMRTTPSSGGGLRTPRSQSTYPSPRASSTNLRGVARRTTPGGFSPIEPGSGSGVGGGGGWNDPPSNIFDQSPRRSSDSTSVLIPPAGNGDQSNSSNSLSCPGLLSRNSSRVSLVDASGNARPTSRGPTGSP